MTTYTIAEFAALGSWSGNYTIADTPENIAALGVDEFSDFVSKGVNVFAPSGDITIYSGQINPAVANVTFEGSGSLTFIDTTNYTYYLSAEGYTLLGNAGVDIVGSGSGAITVFVSSLQAVVEAGIHFTDGIAGELQTSDSELKALSFSDFENFYATGIHTLRLTTFGDPTISAAPALFAAQAGFTISTGSFVAVTDTAENFAAFSADDFIDLLSLAPNITYIRVTEGNLILSAETIFAAIAGGVTFGGAGTVTLTDTPENIAAYSETDFASLVLNSIEMIAPTDALSVSAVLAATIASTSLKFADDHPITLADSIENIAALTADQLSILRAAGVDVIDPLQLSGTDSLTLTVAQATLIAESGIPLTQDDTYTLSLTADEFAALSPSTLELFSSAQIDIIDINSSDNPGMVTSDQAQYMLSGGGTHFLASNTVTLMASNDALAYMASTNFNKIGTDGLYIDALYVLDNAVTFESTAPLIAAFDKGLRFVGGVVTLQTETLDALPVSDLRKLGGVGVNLISASSGQMALTVQQALALVEGGVAFAEATQVHIEDTAYNISGLSVENMVALEAAGLDKLVVDGGGVLTWSIQQAITAAERSFAVEPAVVIDDVPGAIAALTAELIATLGSLTDAGVTLHAKDAFALSYVQLDALTTAGIALMEADTITLDVTTAETRFLSPGYLQMIDTIRVTDIGALIPEAFSTVPDPNRLVVDATDNVVSVSSDQASWFTSFTIKFAANDVVTFADTGAQLAATLSVANIARFDTAGFDKLDATDNKLSLSLAQAKALATAGITIASGDAVTLTDTGANLKTLSSAQISALKTTGVDTIDATDNAIALSLAQARSLVAAGRKIASGDVVTVTDTGANLKASITAEIAALDALGIDKLDATDNKLSLSADQAKALAAAGIVAAAGDVVTLADTGVKIKALTAAQISSLKATGVDSIDVSDNILSLTVAQAKALGTAGLSIASGDVATVVDTGANLKTLSVAQIDLLDSAGFDRLNASDNKLVLAVNQAKALAAAGIVIDAGDTVTLTDTGAKIQSLTVAQITALKTTGVDTIDATNDAFVFDMARYASLGSLKVATGDTVTVNGGSGTDSIVARGDTMVLNGKIGADTLTGHKSGADTFAFDTKLGSGNIDRIKSFDTAKDLIGLDDAIFKALGSSMTSTEFRIGTSAKDSSDHIIYDATSGKLFYDVDGKGGTAQVQFALLDKDLSLGSSDFFVL